MVFNSRLTQPLFTRLANLLQNALCATEHMRLQSQGHEFQNNRYQVFVIDIHGCFRARESFRKMSLAFAANA
jgi:hypothetical protein